MYFFFNLRYNASFVKSRYPYFPSSLKFLIDQSVFTTVGTQREYNMLWATKQKMPPNRVDWLLGLMTVRWWISHFRSTKDKELSAKKRIRNEYDQSIVDSVDRTHHQQGPHRRPVFFKEKHFHCELYRSINCTNLENITNLRGVPFRSFGQKGFC